MPLAAGSRLDDVAALAGDARPEAEPALLCAAVNGLAGLARADEDAQRGVRRNLRLLLHGQGIRAECRQAIVDPFCTDAVLFARLGAEDDDRVRDGPAFSREADALRHGDDVNCLPRGPVGGRRIGVGDQAQTEDKRQ